MPGLASVGKNKLDTTPLVDDIRAALSRRVEEVPPGQTRLGDHFPKRKRVGVVNPYSNGKKRKKV